MKATLETKVLKNALKVLTKAIEKKSYMEFLTKVMIKVDGDVITFIGCDLENFATIDIPASDTENGISLVSFAAVKKVVSKYKQPRITIESDDLALKICGASFPCTTDAGNYPEIPKHTGQDEYGSFAPKFEVKPYQISNAIGCAGKDDARVYLNSVYFHNVAGKTRLVSTNGCKLHVCDTETPWTFGNPQVDAGFIAPVSAMKFYVESVKAFNPENTTVCKDENHLYFDHVIEGGVNVALAMRLVDGTYPNYEMVIPAGFKATIQFQPTEMIEALKRIYAIVDDKKDSYVRFLAIGNNVSLTYSYDGNSIVENVGITGNGSLQETGFKVKDFIDILTPANDSNYVNMQIVDTESPCKVIWNDETSFNVIMPVRVDLADDDDATGESAYNEITGDIQPFDKMLVKKAKSRSRKTTVKKSDKDNLALKDALTTIEQLQNENAELRTALRNEQNKPVAQEIPADAPLGDSSQQVKMLAEQNKDLSDKNKSLAIVADSREYRVNSLTEIVTEKNAKIEMLEDDNDSLRQENNESQDTIDELTKRVDELEKENYKLDCDNGAMRDDVEDCEIYQELKAELDEAKAEIARLDRVFRDECKAFNTAQPTSPVECRSCKDLEAKNTELQRTIGMLKESASALDSERNHYLADAVKHAQKASDAMAELKHLKGKAKEAETMANIANEIRNELDAERIKRDEMQAEIDGLALENECMQTINEDYKSEIESLQNPENREAELVNFLESRSYIESRSIAAVNHTVTTGKSEQIGPVAQTSPISKVSHTIQRIASGNGQKQIALTTRPPRMICHSVDVGDTKPLVTLSGPVVDDNGITTYTKFDPPPMDLHHEISLVENENTNTVLYIALYGDKSLCKVTSDPFLCDKEFLKDLGPVDIYKADFYENFLHDGIMQKFIDWKDGDVEPGGDAEYWMHKDASCELIGSTADDLHKIPLLCDECPNCESKDREYKTMDFENIDKSGSYNSGIKLKTVNEVERKCTMSNSFISSGCGRAEWCERTARGQHLKQLTQEKQSQHDRIFVDGYKHYSGVQVAKIVRQKLKENFPGFKFSVRSTYSSIYIEYTDGPSLNAVEDVVGGYGGKFFDGMDDSTSYKHHWLMPDNSVIMADGKNKIEKPHDDAVLIGMSNYSPTVQRELSADGRDVIARAVKDATGWDIETDEGYCNVGWDAKNNSNDTYEMVRREIIKQQRELSMYEKPAPTSTTKSRSYNKPTDDVGIQVHPGVKMSQEGTWTWLFFDGKPDENTRMSLKLSGFRWGKKRGGWYCKEVKSLQQVRDIIETGDPKDPTPPRERDPNAPKTTKTPQSRSLGERLRIMANKMTDGINYKWDSQNGLRMTHRRQAMMESAHADARRMERTQALLRQLAEIHDGTIEAGDEFLLNIKTKKDADIAANHRYHIDYKYGECPEYLITPDSSNKTFKDFTPEGWVKFCDVVDALISGHNPQQAEQDKQREIEKMEMEVARLDIPGYFPTPDSVIDTMLDKLTTEPTYILEPSAGSGAILDAVKSRYPDAMAVCIEPSQSLRAILKAKGHNVIASDALDFKPEGDHTKIDTVLMNPPFEKGADIAHVSAMISLVESLGGGQIVAIMSNAVTFKTDKKTQAFIDKINSLPYCEVETLPEGSFKSSMRSTGVSTCMVHLEI